MQRTQNSTGELSSMSQGHSFTTVEDNLFGTLAVRYNFVLDRQVEEALEVQQSFYVAGQSAPKLGEILAQKGYMTHEQIAAVLRGQSTGSSKKRFGEIAIAHHFCSQIEVDAALKVQSDIRSFGQNQQRIGEILVARGALRPHQVTAILQNQGATEVVSCPACHTALNIAGLEPTAQVRCPSCNTVFVPSDLKNGVGPRPRTAQATSVTRHQTAAPATRSMIGAVVGQYQIESRLGEDSTGVLYKALDPRTGARVTLRMLDPQMVSNPDDYERWVSAEQAARDLSHRNLQAILAMNTEHGRPYLVMDFVEGDSLRKIMERRGVFPAVDAVGILVQLAEALEYGASRGLLHGDLRPVHVLLGADGVVRLSGLGIPKNAALNLRQMAGQFSEESLPLYTPPEVMIDPEQADERSDIYSLGAIGYHMLAGRPPHEGTGLVQLGFRMAASKITPAREINPRIPEFVSKLIGRCLQLDANARYDSPTLLLNDLRKASAALMAGEEAPDLTESLRTNNYVPVTARRAPRMNRLKRLKTHITRGGHGTHGPTKRSASPASSKNASSSNARLSQVGGAVPVLPPLPLKNPSANASGTSPAVLNVRAPMGRAANSGVNPAINLPPLPQLHPKAGSSSSIPAVVSPPGFGASSSSLNAAIPGLAPSAQPIMPEDISDIANDLTPGMAPAKRSGAAYEVIKTLDVNADPISGEPRLVTRRVRAQPKRISNSAIVVTCVVSAVVIGAGIAGIYFSYAGSSTVPVVVENKTKLLTPPITKPDISTPGVEEAQDWHNFELYSKDHDKDFKGLVEHLRYFVSHHPSGEHGPKATDLLKKYSSLGAEQTVTNIRDTVRNFLKTDAFADAATAIEKWRDEWKEGKDIATLEKSLKDDIAESQKGSAQILMDQAVSLRKDQKFADARALYERIKFNFPAEYKNLAAKAQVEADKEEQTAKDTLLAEERTKKESESKATRDAAAPAIFDRLDADVSSAFKTFDVIGAGILIDAAKDRLVGTVKEADLNSMKKELDHLTALRARMTKAIKDGKMRDQKIKYHETQCVLSDASIDGPVLQLGAGTVPIKWSEVNADDLSDIAGRATDSTNGDELLEAGMLRFYTGKYLEAFQSFTAAQKQKADTGKWIEAAQAAIKDAENKEEKSKESALAEIQAESAKNLAAMGLEVRHGIWKASNNGVLQVSQDPKEPKADLMSLQRKIKKTFKSITVEVRGNGDAAGFSFSGEGRRYLVKPGANWQKVTVERGATGVVLKVDDEETPSIEKIAFDVTPANLVSDGIIYIRFVGVRGEFRNLVVSE
jgi:serine/threonine protein kinase